MEIFELDRVITLADFNDLTYFNAKRNELIELVKGLIKQDALVAIEKAKYIDSSNSADISYNPLTLDNYLIINNGNSSLSNENKNSNVFDNSKINLPDRPHLNLVKDVLSSYTHIRFFPTQIEAG